MRTYIYIQHSILIFLFLAPLLGSAQNGTSMYDAISAGVFDPMRTQYFYDYRNNYYYNGVYYEDNYTTSRPNGQASPDVWYKFTVERNIVDMRISLCGSALNTYIHLLDELGNELVSSDAFTECGSSQIDYAGLSLGTYYLVVEGYGLATGTYNVFIESFPTTLSLPPGANMENAIDAGTLTQSGPSYTDQRSNYNQLLGDYIGQPSIDIYYKFTLSNTSEVVLSHCGSDIDTYMHLLNSSGQVLTSNDDNYNSPCPGTRAYIQTTLAPGTYYLVSEGYSDYTGIITTTIDLLRSPNISYESSVSLRSGASVSLLPTNTGGFINIDERVTTLAGPFFEEGGNPLNSFSTPYGVAVGIDGNIYVANADDHQIRKITPAGVVSTFAGSGSPGSVDGFSMAASFNTPKGIAIDSYGNVYVSDAGNHKIRKITSSGLVSTLAGSGFSGSSNGVGSGASFNDPREIALDDSGNIYVADASNHMIRKITPLGTVTTFAGDNVSGFQDGIGSAARFNHPTGLVVDGSGNIYVADNNNHSIRKISPERVVSTFAGNGSPGSDDGIGATARFNYPVALAGNSLGDLYVADEWSNVIRKISSIGAVTTFAGSGISGEYNGLPLDSDFGCPQGLAVNPIGNVFVADTDNGLIRKIGSAQGYSISPDLPVGLNFNNQTGEISGIPIFVSPLTTYSIIAQNNVGSSTATISIEIFSDPGSPSQDRNYILTYSPREPIGDEELLIEGSISRINKNIQYFDGLGRSMQIVDVLASSNGEKDLVVPIVYDEFGRETIKYLPFAQEGNSSKYKENALTALVDFYNPSGSSGTQLPSGIARIPTPYAETVFEASRGKETNQSYNIDNLRRDGVRGLTLEPGTGTGCTGGCLAACNYAGHYGQNGDDRVCHQQRYSLYPIGKDPQGGPL